MGFAALDGHHDVRAPGSGDADAARLAHEVADAEGAGGDRLVVRVHAADHHGLGHPGQGRDARAGRAGRAPRVGVGQRLGCRAHHDVEDLHEAGHLGRRLLAVGRARQHLEEQHVVAEVAGRQVEGVADRAERLVGDDERAFARAESHAVPKRDEGGGPKVGGDDHGRILRLSRLHPSHATVVGHAPHGPGRPGASPTSKESGHGQRDRGTQTAPAVEVLSPNCRRSRAARRTNGQRPPSWSPLRRSWDSSAQQDTLGTVVVRKPASAGHEKAPTHLPPGPPRHGVREAARQDPRLPEGSHHARAPRQHDDGRRHDARRRQRRGRRDQPRHHGGHLARARPARVPLHDRRGDGPDRREQPRSPAS